MNVIFLKKTIEDAKKVNAIPTLNFFLERDGSFFTIDKKLVKKELVDVVVPLSQREVVGVPDFVYDKITGIFDYENILNFDLEAAKKSIFSVIFPESLI
jgi:hypothetical protein